MVHVANYPAAQREIVFNLSKEALCGLIMCHLHDCPIYYVGILTISDLMLNWVHK